MKQLFAFALVALLLVPVIGCDGDPKRPTTKVEGDEKPLTEEWHVLYNLVLAYNTKDIDAYAAILDPDHFTFFFYPGDVGGSVPAQWDYLAEMGATTHMLTGGGGVENNPIRSLDIALFNLKTVEWSDVTDGDFPG